MIQQAYCKWSEEEKDKLVDVVTKYKAMNQKLDWTQIQNHVGTKTVRQCYDQYVRQFKKQHKTDAKPTWTVQEERKLVKVFKHSQQIVSDQVVDKVGNRQYSKWNQKEKDKLVEQINKFNEANVKPDWVEIQSCIKTKTIRQCYDQCVILFKKIHNTDTRHIWTVQEEQRLANVFQQNPYKWEVIQTQFPNLNIVQLKNKIGTLIRQHNKKIVCKDNVDQSEKSERHILAGQLGNLLGL
ncbi:Myb-like_DNA-binding domain-containing protein [Hexamita inflata]|uniref:Myb-like DNA-binding domain-containing protein n=1 Tax=Hexamita inflata TaxID=28002 RepID=A0AA86NXA7_9EUKA|nr:Myb-like DNA-binding domain-containing protein [Hexamita inflata]